MGVFFSPFFLSFFGLRASGGGSRYLEPSLLIHAGHTTITSHQLSKEWM